MNRGNKWKLINFDPRVERVNKTQSFKDLGRLGSSIDLYKKSRNSSPSKWSSYLGYWINMPPKKESSKYPLCFKWGHHLNMVGQLFLSPLHPGSSKYLAGENNEWLHVNALKGSKVNRTTQYDFTLISQENTLQKRVQNLLNLMTST